MPDAPQLPTPGARPTFGKRLALAIDDTTLVVEAINRLCGRVEPAVNRLAMLIIAVLLWFGYIAQHLPQPPR